MPGLQTICFSLALFALLAALLGRILTAVALAVYLLAGIVVASMIMKSYLGVPLTISDLQFFFGNPIDDLQLFRNYPTLGAGFAALLVGVVVIVLVGLRFERPRLPSARGRLVALVAATLVGGYPLTLPAATKRPPGLAPSDPSALPDDWDAWTAFEDMRSMEKVDGGLALLDAFFAHRGMDVTLPARRATTRFTPAAPATTGGAAESASGDAVRSPNDPSRPDVMVILEESVFDPRLIAKCTLPGCNVAMFGPPAAGSRSRQGPLLVHTAGGGTWLTEFSVVSGFDWRTFGRGGAYAPVSIAPRLRRALPRYLQSLGYRTVVVSPTGGDFLRARNAYRQYGFEEFYAAQELGFADDWLSVHDGEVFDKALKAIAQRPDPRPIFLFVLTIRNHGPHGAKESNVSPAMRAERQAFDAPLADYLGRLQDSSRELAELQKRWFASPRPRVLGWFGDHQPELTQWFLETPADVTPGRIPPNVDANQRRYVTWYQFAANYGTASTRRDEKALDVPFFGTELLRFAGLPLDAEHRASAEVAERCDGRLLGCADRELVTDFIAWRIYDLGAVAE